jgi:hypothetical protein
VKEDEEIDVDVEETDVNVKETDIDVEETDIMTVPLAVGFGAEQLRRSQYVGVAVPENEEELNGSSSTFM